MFNRRKRDRRKELRRFLDGVDRRYRQRRATQDAAMLRTLLAAAEGDKKAVEDTLTKIGGR